MYCTECGHEDNDVAEFCSNCGQAKSANRQSLAGRRQRLSASDFPQDWEDWEVERYLALEGDEKEAITDYELAQYRQGVIWKWPKSVSASQIRAELEAVGEQLRRKSKRGDRLASCLSVLIFVAVILGLFVWIASWSL